MAGYVLLPRISRGFDQISHSFDQAGLALPDIPSRHRLACVAHVTLELLRRSDEAEHHSQSRVRAPQRVEAETWKLDSGAFCAHDEFPLKTVVHFIWPNQICVFCGFRPLKSVSKKRDRVCSSAQRCLWCGKRTLLRFRLAHLDHTTPHVDGAPGDAEHLAYSEARVERGFNDQLQWFFVERGEQQLRLPGFERTAIADFAACAQLDPLARISSHGVAPHVGSFKYTAQHGEVRLSRGFREPGILHLVNPLLHLDRINLVEPQWSERRLDILLQTVLEIVRRGRFQAHQVRRAINGEQIAKTHLALYKRRRVVHVFQLQVAKLFCLALAHLIAIAEIHGLFAPSNSITVHQHVDHDPVVPLRTLRIGLQYVRMLVSSPAHFGESLLVGEDITESVRTGKSDQMGITAGTSGAAPISGSGSMPWHLVLKARKTENRGPLSGLAGELFWMAFVLSCQRRDLTSRLAGYGTGFSESFPLTLNVFMQNARPRGGEVCVRQDAGELLHRGVAAHL